MEKASCLSAWEEDGDNIYFVVINKIYCMVLVLTRIFYQVEMTGDYTPDLMALLSADIIISTPEKWDGISRNWHSRSYVMKVRLFLVIFSNGISFSLIYYLKFLIIDLSKKKKKF